MRQSDLTSIFSYLNKNFGDAGITNKILLSSLTSDKKPKMKGKNLNVLHFVKNKFQRGLMQNFCRYLYQYILSNVNKFPSLI